MVIASTRPHECNWKNNVNTTFSGQCLKNRDLPKLLHAVWGKPKTNNWTESHFTSEKNLQIDENRNDFHVCKFLSSLIPSPLKLPQRYLRYYPLVRSLFGGRHVTFKHRLHWQLRLLDAALRKPRFARPAGLGSSFIGRVNHRGL